MTRAELIAHYEKQLKKVIASYGGDRLNKWDAMGCTGADYIKQAEQDLEAVKNGREW